MQRHKNTLKFKRHFNFIKCTCDKCSHKMVCQNVNSLSACTGELRFLFQKSLSYQQKALEMIEIEFKGQSMFR